MKRPRAPRLFSLLLLAPLITGCGPGGSQPQGVPTPAEMHTPVPAASGFPAEPVIPTPQGPGETFPPAPPPSSLPTP